MRLQFDRPGTKTTAAEITRNFGHWQDRALREPILVTHHGRPRVVIVSAEEYERAFCPSAGHSGGEPASDDSHWRRDLNLLLFQMYEGFIAFDEALRVRFANAAAIVNTELGPDDIVGRSLDDPCLGEIGVMVASRLRRVLRTGEVMQFEIAGVFHRHRRYDIKAFPFQEGVAITYCQLTELYDLRDTAESRAGLDRALAGLHGLLQCGVSAMGYVTNPNRGVCDLLGFTPEHVVSARLIDFVIPASRRDLGERLNEVVGGQADGYEGEVKFLTHSQTEVPVRLSIVRDVRAGVCNGLAVAGMRL